MQRVDLTGKKFGLLTAISPAPFQKLGKKNRSSWLCECECGNEVQVLTCNLNRRNPNSTSCGCKFLKSIKYNFTDLTGKTFGSLTVIKKLDKKTKTRGILWECKCACGEITNLPSNSLTSGNTVTCGNKIHYPVKKTGEIPNSHINAIKQNATKRDLLFSASEQFLWALFLKQERKCALSGVDLVFSEKRKESTASLDRIDSDVGYIEGNVRWVHKDVNRFRWVMDDKQLVDWSKKILLKDLSDNRVDWDHYFLLMAQLAATRSRDPSTKHGCVITDSQHRVVSTGYNGPVQGIDDAQVPLERPEKYNWFIHAEQSAIVFAQKDLRDCTAYITGFPCATCANLLAQAGISKIKHGSLMAKCVDQKMKEDVLKIMKLKNVLIEEIT